MSGAEKGAGEAAETARIVEGIEKTRADMSGTIAALETKLSPTEIRTTVEGELHHVEEKVREVVREHLAEAKVLVKEELVEVKALLRTEMEEAESKLKKGLVDVRAAVKKDLAEEVDHVEAKLRQGISDAKDSVKTELKEAFTGATTSVRAATLGRVEDLATTIGDTMNDTRETLVDTIRNNPIPAALAGIGIAWLFMNRSSAAKRPRGGRVDVQATGNGRSGMLHGAQSLAGHVVDDVGNALHRAGDAAGSAVHGATDAVGNVLHQATDAAGSVLQQATNTASSAAHGAADAAARLGAQTSHAATALAHTARDASSSVAHGASDAASYLAHGAQSQARRVSQGFATTLEENPLALGAAALAMGAVIGYALPRTHAEDVLMGDARDAMMQRAGDVTTDVASRVGTFAEKTAGGVKEMLALDNGSK